MTSALIGYTGFVGGNLQDQAAFDDLYNSKNIENIAGKSYELLVSAGGPAVRWQANKEPEKDRRALQRLMDCLSKVSAKKFVLMSTIDVYADPVEVDEDAPIELSELKPYGKHRREVEIFVEDRFDASIIRLPNLFGPGLKKNVVYDLLHDNLVEQIHAEAVYQYYNLKHLWRDTRITLDNRLRVVNFSTEPVSVREMAREAFGLDFQNRPTPAAPRYDFKSKFAGLYGGAGGYLYDKVQVLSELKQFVDETRAANA